MKTLYLYGPPASGKTTLARRLAKEFGRPALDLDEEIERRSGRKIAEIFKTDGEAAFRKLECETLRQVAAPIVALGGGTLLDSANREYCEQNGFVVVLAADPETIAARVAAAGGVRPLGDRYAERQAHYASFAHQLDADAKILLPRKLRGKIVVPPSKSHLHRLLIAEFLAGKRMVFASDPRDCEDILATRRCLQALGAARDRGVAAVTLDVGESGSTLRFLAPLAAALGLQPEFLRRGRLAARPMLEYPALEPGLHQLRGDVSSQFVTGLLFALPLLSGDSKIRFTTPLQSRGYVDLTLEVLARYGVRVETTAQGFDVPGGQHFVSPGPIECEGDWSAAAFWYAANQLGSEIKLEGLSPSSRQPDRMVAELLSAATPAGSEVDVSGCPDLYPALAITGKFKRFTGTERLRLKESDRLAAIERLLANPRDVDAANDHRIAMAAAILSTVADGPTIIHGASSVAKSYPGFWDEFKLELVAVTGWPLAKTSSPEIHNAAYAAAGRKAEMIAYPAATIESALGFAEQCAVKGLAVTIPHKQSVLKHLDEIAPTARAIGAVNTVVFRDGRRIGYNTDADGFWEAVSKYRFRRAALLGDGGAAKAVRYALQSHGCEVETFHRRPLVGEFDLIVNATPVDPIPEYEFTGREIVYDLRYVPAETPLMARARAKGCTVENGYSMLVAQARRQRELFFEGT